MSFNLLKQIFLEQFNTYLPYRRSQLRGPVTPVISALN